MTFKKGASGNPNGRPRGIIDRRQLFLELVDSHKDSLINKAVEMALSGNEQMLKLLLDRILPAKPKDNMVPEIDILEGNFSEQGRQVLRLVSEGVITPSEGNELMKIILGQVNLEEIDEMKRRLDILMEAHEKGRHG